MALIPILQIAILEEEERRRIRRRTIRPHRSESFSLPENEFVNLFRLNKQLAQNLIYILRSKLEHRSSNKNALSAELKVSVVVSIICIFI